MEHVKAALSQLAHENKIDLVVSKRQLKRIESIELIRDQRQQGIQALAFNSRPFVLCGLPEVSIATILTHAKLRDQAGRSE